MSLNTVSVGVSNLRSMVLFKFRNLSEKFLAYGFVEPCNKVGTHILGLAGSVS